MSDTGPVMAYLLRRAYRRKNVAIYSVRTGGVWIHTAVDRARVWELTISLGRRVVEGWLVRGVAA